MASATWHVARRCFATVRSGKLLCLAGTWRRIVADRASVPIHSISDRPPPFQRVAIVELLDEAFRKQLLGCDYQLSLDDQAPHRVPDERCRALSAAACRQALLAAASARLLPGFSAAFGVDVAHLVMTDVFVVRYRPGVQASLGRHVDESCLSFVVQLNDPSEFVGGGTLFDFAAQPLSAPAGSALLFSGRMRHEGVRVVRGERYILAGFVGLSAPRSVARNVSAALQASGGAACPVHTLLDRPDLRYNAAKLRERADGASGERLVRKIARESARDSASETARESGDAPPPQSGQAAGLARACHHWLLTGSLVPPGAGGRRQARVSEPQESWSEGKGARVLARFLLAELGHDRLERELRRANATARSAGERRAVALSRVALDDAHGASGHTGEAGGDRADRTRTWEGGA